MWSQGNAWNDERKKVAVKRKEELPPEDSALIRILLHLLIASHWGCRKISAACHYACRSDFSFTQLAYHWTIWSVWVCVFTFAFVSHFFCLSYTLQWKTVTVIGKVRMVYKLIKCSSIACHICQYSYMCVFMCVSVNAAWHNLLNEDRKRENPQRNIPSFTFWDLFNLWMHLQTSWSPFVHHTGYQAYKTAFIPTFKLLWFIILWILKKKKIGHKFKNFMITN